MKVIFQREKYQCGNNFEETMVGTRGNGSSKFLLVIDKAKRNNSTRYGGADIGTHDDGHRPLQRK